jgi:hypothetical protein
MSTQKAVKPKIAPKPLFLKQTLGAKTSSLNNSGSKKKVTKPKIAPKSEKVLQLTKKSGSKSSNSKASGSSSVGELSYNVYNETYNHLPGMIVPNKSHSLNSKSNSHSHTSTKNSGTKKVGPPTLPKPTRSIKLKAIPPNFIRKTGQRKKKAEKQPMYEEFVPNNSNNTNNTNEENEENVSTHVYEKVGTKFSQTMLNKINSALSKSNPNQKSKKSVTQSVNKILNPNKNSKKKTKSIFGRIAKVLRSCTGTKCKTQTITN